MKLCADDYVTTWRRVLVDGMGWPSTRFNAWLQRTQLAELLEDPESVLYHEPPQSVLTDVLIPQVLRKRLSPPQLRRLRTELTDYLAELDPQRIARWAVVREQVEQILLPFKAETANRSQTSGSLVQKHPVKVSKAAKPVKLTSSRQA